MRNLILVACCVISFVIGYTYRHFQAENLSKQMYEMEDKLYRAEKRIDGLVDALGDKSAMEALMQRFPLIDVRLEFKRGQVPVKKVVKK